MRKRDIIFAVLALVVAAVPFKASAQEHKRVEVTTIYNPEVQPAKKLAVPTVIEDSPVIEPEINYGITPDTWQIELDDHYINPAKASFWDFGRAKRFHTQLGSGYPLISRATLRYATENVRLGYFGFGVDHGANFASKRSSDGVLRSMADSYDMRNRAYIGGGVFSGCQMFEIGLEYTCDLFNNYATAAYQPNGGSQLVGSPDMIPMVSKPDLLVFHDADLVLRYGDDFANLSRLNFAVEAHGGIWSHALPPSGCTIFREMEYRAGGSLHFARRFGQNRIDLKGGFDMWQVVEDDYRNTRFDITVSYARKFGFVSVDASLGYMYDRVRSRTKPSHFFIPSARVVFDTGLRAITPYVELNTTVSQNGISNLYGENPYLNYRYYVDDVHTPDKLDMFDAMANTRSYNLAAGFTGSDNASRVEYRLKVGANFMRDQLIWYVATPGTFSVATENNNRLFAGVEVDYRPVGGLLIAGKFYAHADNTDSPYVVDDARVKANVKVEYSIKRWKLYASGDFTGSRKWSGAVIDAQTRKAPVVFEAQPSFDLRAGVSLRTSKLVEIYVDGYNLLGSQIYDYAYYYRNGAGFMAGVKIDF